MPRTDDKELINTGATPVRPQKKYSQLKKNSHLLWRTNISDHRLHVSQAVPNIAPADVDRIEEILDLGAGVTLRARIFTPKGKMQEELPTVFWFDGTAWVAASDPYGEMIASHVAKQSGHRVIQVELLLAPENGVLRIKQFAWRFLEHCYRNAEHFKMDPRNIAILGYSTGADIALYVDNRASRAGITVTQKILVSGVYDLSDSVEHDKKYRRYNKFANRDPQIPKSFIKFWRDVAVPVIDRKKPSVSCYFQNSHSKNLTRLVYGSIDCARAENEAEYQHLLKQGVDVERIIVEQGGHSRLWQDLDYIQFVARLLNTPKTGDTHHVNENYETISPRLLRH